MTHLRLDRRVPVHETSQDRPRDGLKARQEAEHHRAARAQPRPQDRLCLLGGVESVPRLLQERGTGGRQADAAGVPLEQGQPDARLELGDRLGQRRLCDVELRGRTRYLARFSDRELETRLAEAQKDEKIHAGALNAYQNDLQNDRPIEIKQWI